MTIKTKGKPPSSQQGGMTALLSSNAAHAASFTPSDDQLTKWYNLQLAAVTAHVAAIGAVVEEMASPANALTRTADPTWPAYYANLARYRFNLDTLRMIETAGHVVSCPTHGPTGCGAGLTEEQSAALAYRGYTTKEPKLAWQRICETCGAEQIKAHAERLLHAHRTGATT